MCGFYAAWTAYAVARFLEERNQEWAKWTRTDLDKFMDGFATKEVSKYLNNDVRSEVRAMFKTQVAKDQKATTKTRKKVRKVPEILKACLAKWKEGDILVY